MARIAVLGATGNIGSRIVTEAKNRRHEVTAIVRDPSKVTADVDVRVVGDVLDEDALTEAVRGHDVVVSALGAGSSSPDRTLYVRAAEAYDRALRSLGAQAPRLIAVGGAASLEVAPGTRLIDTPEFPEAWKAEASAQADALAYYRGLTDLRWTYFSPAAEIGPGERTGRYETGTERLVTDGDGNSRISYEDYAAALVDEIENPRHVGARFTAAAV